MSTNVVQLPVTLGAQTVKTKPLYSKQSSLLACGSYTMLLLLCQEPLVCFSSRQSRVASHCGEQIMPHLSKSTQYYVYNELDNVLLWKYEVAVS